MNSKDHNDRIENAQKTVNLTVVSSADTRVCLWVVWKAALMADSMGDLSAGTRVVWMVGQKAARTVVCWAALKGSLWAEWTV